ncbi:hypothetical protein ACM66B_002794 [Microbotryomycetes sp. NB124-2]
MIRSSSRSLSRRRASRLVQDHVQPQHSAPTRPDQLACPACRGLPSSQRSLTNNAPSLRATAPKKTPNILQRQAPATVIPLAGQQRRAQHASALEPRPSLQRDHKDEQTSSTNDTTSTSEWSSLQDANDQLSNVRTSEPGASTSSSSSPPAPQVDHDDNSSRAAQVESAIDFWAQLVKPDNPTREDVDFLKPRRIVIPDASSPPSHRTVYSKVWASALSRIDHAFNKRQLATLVTDTLRLNLQDVRLRTDVKRTKRWSNSKVLSKWSKKDLCIAIMVLHWDMVDPEVIPPPGTSSQVVDSVQVSDRTLFLLLEPRANTLATLMKRFGVKLSFTREPSTGVLMLNFKGGEAAVEQAKTEVELLAEKSVQRELQLPRDATELRPEVYQAVSRTTKTYLEPGSKPDVIAATSTQQRNVDQAELMLATAFADDAAAKYTSVFASVPSSFTSLEYALSPMTPTCPPVFPANSAPMFARVRQVSRLSEQQSDRGSTTTNPDESALTTSVDDIAQWTDKMRIGSTDQTHIYTSASSSLPSSSMSTVLSSLLRPFSKELDMVTDVEFDLEARFGHVAWPLYSRRSAINATTLGPSLDGAWDLDTFKSWKQGAGRDVKSVFLPSPPVGFLASTGLLQRSMLPNPLEFLTNPTATGLDLDKKPSFESESYRQIVFKPRGGARGGPSDVDCLERIEVKCGGDGMWQGNRVKQSTVQVMIPTGACDFQLTLSCHVPLDAADLPDTNYNSNVPRTITLEGQEYVMSSDYLTRLTTISPPRQHESSNFEFVSRVESSHDRRGQTTRSTVLSRITTHSIGLDRKVGKDELESGALVKRLVETVEKKALRKWVGRTK